MKKWLKNTFEVIKKDGDWELLVNRPVYRTIQAFENHYILNTETGENCGQYIELHCTLFDQDGNRLEEPIYDKNCYEIVEYPND